MSTALINSQEISYEDSGGTNPAIIFMHGFLMDKTMFDHQVEMLAGHYRCVRFDARAFGATKWDHRPFSFYDTAADCIGLMDHLGIKRAVIAGMSQGGYAALRLALRYPARVKALVLMSTRSSVDDEQTQNSYREMLATWQIHGPIEPLVCSVMEMLIGPRDQHADLWDRLLPKWKARTKEELSWAMNNILTRDDIDAQLSQIQAPAMVIHGEADQGIPIKCAEQLASDLPHCRVLLRVPGAAHAPNLTHPQVVNPPLGDFLEQYGR